MTAATGPSERRTVFLHVGAPKTGTTYLQSKLWHNREALRRDGFCYPGKEWPAHVWAALDLRRVKFRGVTDPNVPGVWRKLVREIRQSGGPGIIDQELLSGARPEHIDRAFADLDWADVHVVYTLRDMARTLPSAWQERVKNRELDSFAEFLQIVHLPEEERRRTGNRFWHLNDTPTVLTRWSAHVPPENVHVVTLPPSGSDPSILWTRFATLLGLDPDRYEEPGEGSNTSLAAPDATVLRRVNNAIGGPDFPWPVYDTVVKHYLAVEMASRKGPAISLPPEEYEWAVEWSHHMADFIRERGFDVVGDLDEIIPTAQREGVDPDAVDGDSQADAAVDALALVLKYVAERSNNDVRVAALEAQVRELEDRLRTLRAEPPKQKIKRTLVELSDQVGWVGTAYGAYRKVKHRNG
jgi:hypothetical protein